MRKFTIGTKAAAALALLASATTANAASIDVAGKSAINVEAISMFLVFVLATLGITKWAAGRTKSAADFYAAGVERFEAVDAPQERALAAAGGADDRGDFAARDVHRNAVEDAEVAVIFY